MARRFRGEHLHKLDSKGRVSIPAQFRNVLADNDPHREGNAPPEMVIVYGGPEQDFLECYTMRGIEEVEDKIELHDAGSEEREELELLFLTLSTSIKLDETGRLVLPAKLRDKIGAEKELTFIGKGDRFQIWKPEAWEAKLQNLVEARADKTPRDPRIHLDRPPRRDRGMEGA